MEGKVGIIMKVKGKDLEIGMFVRDETFGFGKIVSICDCEFCKERGFQEPIISYRDGSEDYVSIHNKDNCYDVAENLTDLIKNDDILLTKTQWENKKGIILDVLREEL